MKVKARHTGVRASDGMVMTAGETYDIPETDFNPALFEEIKAPTKINKVEVVSDGKNDG